MSFGDPSKAMGWTIPEAEALPVLKRAFDLGINTWDTVRHLVDSKMPLDNTDYEHYRRTSIPLVAQNASLGKHFENTAFLANESFF